MCLVTWLCPTVCDSVEDNPPAPLSMGFSRQEYWSELPFPLPGDAPDPGMERVSPVSPYCLVDPTPLSQPGSPSALWVG